jgi:S1-C subfamily serine protease
MKKLMLGLLMLAAGCSSIPTHSPTNQINLTETQKSTVYIISESSLCSAWVLKGTHKIITAAHCKDEQMTVSFDATGDHKYPLKIVKEGDAQREVAPDVMVLTTDDPKAPWPVGLPLCTFKPYYGEDLVDMGAPLGIPGAMQFGKVTNPHVDYGIGGLIQFGNAIYPGNSGGAVIDTEQGCVMGIAELVHMTTPESQVPYGLYYLTPASAVEEFIK